MINPDLYEYLIALGSSIAPREQYLSDCQSLISKRIGLISASATPISTPPFGPNAKQEFLNSALIVLSTLRPGEVIRDLLGIEKELGRERSLHWADRTIDCDIILARKTGENITIKQQNLEIPHPLCHTRDFVLIPCSEIAGDWLHPGQNKKVSELLTLLH